MKHFLLQRKELQEPTFNKSKKKKVQRYHGANIQMGLQMNTRSVLLNLLKNTSESKSEPMNTS